MHIDRISYQKTYNLGNYSSERIGVEIELNAGEDAKNALDVAKSLVEEYHKESAALYPMPFQEEIEIPIISNATREALYETTVVHDQTLEEQIASCTDIKVLESYKFIAKKDEALQLAYDKRMFILKMESAQKSKPLPNI